MSEIHIKIIYQKHYKRQIWLYYYVLRISQTLNRINADYAVDIAILANTPNQAETLLHSLEWAAEGIGLYVNAHKT